MLATVDSTGTRTARSRDARAGVVRSSMGGGMDVGIWQLLGLFV